MRRLSDSGAMSEAERFKTLTLGRAVESGAGGVALPEPTAQNQMIISNAALVWSLLAAPSAQYQVPIAGADPYTPAWAALTVAAISDLAYATPALTLSTANAEGAADTVVRSDATIAIFDATVPTIIQPDDAAAAGSAGVAAQRDHRHGIVCGTPASPSVSLAASTEGTGTPFARAGHAHQLDQTIVPTWTGLHTFNASVIVYRSSQAISAYRTHVTGEAHHRFYITTGGALYWGSGGAAPDVILYRSAANTLRLEDTLAVNIGITLAGGTGVNAITIPDNVAQAVHLVDVGGLEYLRFVSTDTQPAVVFNEAGADVDFWVEASGQASALFVQGSSGNVGLKTNTPAADLQVVGSTVSNKHYGAYRTLILEDDNVVLQLIGEDATTGMAHIILTAAPASGDNKHWLISHFGPAANNRFSIGYKTTNADNWAGYQPSEYFIITTGGNAGFGATNPLSEVQLESGSPRLTFLEDDAAADNQIWDFCAAGEQFRGRAINDAYNVFANWLLVDRTGTVIDSVEFPQGTVKIASLAGVGVRNVVADAAGNLSAP